MTGCNDCARAEKNPRTCRFTADCKECSARSLAQSPAFFDSERAGRMLPTYAAALRFVWGADAQAGHEKVKAWAARLSA